MFGRDFVVGGVKEYLEQQAIVTSVNWIDACITFLEEEDAQVYTKHNLKNLVYQQWLNADLEEIGVPCLPSELSTLQKTTLNGCFVLQVNGMRDVGKPAYAQLRDIEKVESDADFNAAPEEPLPAWEAKPTRMLMLNLTDGCTHIRGMEYRQINTLSPNLPPGFKVLIRGPVDCRFGVLLLTSDNIEIYGGEVESKLEQFSRKAILKEVLQIPAENEDIENDTISSNIPDNSDLSPSESLPTTSDTSRPSVSQNRPIPNTATRTNHSNNPNTRPSNTSRRPNVSAVQNARGNQARDFTDDIFDDDFDGNMNNRTRAVSERSSSRNQPVSNDLASDNMDALEMDDDDFVQSLDYNALDEIERISNSQSGNVRNDVDEPDFGEEDEDVLRELMAFQEENPGFDMPYSEPSTSHATIPAPSEVKKERTVTDLVSVLKHQPSNCTVTIKGFMVTVLSKLECTLDKGWSLSVKVSDGTEKLDVDIHDKVLEEMIGISAPAMVKLQLEAATDAQKHNEVMVAISKCKRTLKVFNGLMDIKFSSDSKPCLLKCYTAEET